MANAIAPPQQPKPQEWTIEVEAHRKGTYPQPRQLSAWYREPGARFFIKDMSHFSKEWMLLPGDQAQPSEIQGHGLAPAPQDGSTPMTTIRNEVRNPLQVMNDLARADQNAARGR